MEQTETSSRNDLFREVLNLATAGDSRFEAILKNPEAYRFGTPKKTKKGYLVETHTDSWADDILISDTVIQAVNRDPRYEPVKQLFAEADRTALDEAIRKRNKYSPSRLEIAGELARGAAGSVKRAAAWSKEFAIAGGVIFAGTSIFPYALPSWIRWFGGIEDDGSKEKPGEVAGAFVGLITGVAGFVGQGVLYEHLTHNGYPELLLIPVGTNMASLAGEGVRTGYKFIKNKTNNARQRLIAENRDRPAEQFI